MRNKDKKNDNNFDFDFDMFALTEHEFAESDNILYGDKIKINKNKTDKTENISDRHNKIKNKQEKKIDDTLELYKETLPLKSVEKLVFKTKQNSDADNEDDDNNEDIKSSYSKFLSIYSANDNRNINLNNKDSDKKSERIKTDTATEFLDKIKDNNDAFDYDYTRPKSSFGKIFMSFLFVVSLGVIAFLIFEVKELKTKISDLNNQVSESEKDKERLQETLVENESLKKMIENISNGEPIYNNINSTTRENAQNNDQQIQTQSNTENNISNNDETEYIVQKGDTLSSISKKFYGSTTTYTKIIDRNKLSGENLAENQKLFIPKN